MPRRDKYDEDTNWWQLLCCGTKWPIARQLQMHFYIILVVLSILAVNETSDICNKCSEMIAIPNASRTAANNRTSVKIVLI